MGFFLFLFFNVLPRLRSAARPPAPSELPHSSSGGESWPENLEGSGRGDGERWRNINYCDRLSGTLQLIIAHLPAAERLHQRGARGDSLRGNRALEGRGPGSPVVLEGGWGEIPSTSWNLCRFAPRHLGVSSLTVSLFF